MNPAKITTIDIDSVQKFALKDSTVTSRGNDYSGEGPMGSSSLTEAIQVVYDNVSNFSIGFKSNKGIDNAGLKYTPISLVPVESSGVVAKYVDEKGLKVADSVSYKGIIGDSYTTEQKDINGYTFKEVTGNVTGTFTNEEQEVTYVYTKNPVKASPVTVHYVDTEGTKLSSDVLLEGNVGDSYTTEQKEFAGYTFKEVKGNTTGTFTDQEQEVTYVYEKAQVNPIVPPSENNNNPEDNNTNEEHSIDSPQNENDVTQFPQTGEQVGSNIWGYIGFALLASSVFIFIKRKKV